MSKFKVGQKVAVYTVKGRIIAEVVLIEGEKIHVSKGRNHGLLVHSKQCHPIKPKRKAREFLIRTGYAGALSVHPVIGLVQEGETILVREVPPKSGKGDGK